MGAFQAGIRTLRASSTVAMVLLCAFLIADADVLSAQRVAEEFKLNLAKPSKAAPVGAWGVERHDPDALALMEDRLVEAGVVGVRGSAEPSKQHNAYKLRRAGVIDLNGELVLGAEWDFHHPIREAIRVIKDSIPEDSSRPARWPASDQALYELGRQAVPYIEAKQAIESILTDIAAKRMVRAFLQRVLSAPPSTIPEVLPASSSPEPLERLKPLLQDVGARAVLMLGPQVRSELERLVADLAVLPEVRNDNIREVTSANPIVLYARQLLFGLDLLDETFQQALNGSEKVPAFQVGLPQSLQRADSWPKADQTFLRVGGLGALATLNTIRATNRAFAVKANWLSHQIRFRYADKLISDMLLMLKNDIEALDGYFDIQENATIQQGVGEVIPDPLLGIKRYDHLLTLIVLSSELKDAMARQRERAKTLKQTGVPANIEESERIALLDIVMRKAFTNFTDRSSAAKVSRAFREFRAEPNRMDELRSKLNILLANENAKGFGQIQRLRSEASRLEAKFNWMRDLIISRDRKAGQEKFRIAAAEHAASFGVSLTRTELEVLGIEGRIAVSKLWAQAHGRDFDVLIKKGMFEGSGSEEDPYEYRGDPRYKRLRHLSRADFEKLIKNGRVDPAVGVSFYGDEQNDGAQYDYQNDVAAKGLSIDLVDPESTARKTFTLVPGRTYEFSFEYQTYGLDGAKTWVNFVPLNAEGQAITPDGRPLTEVFDWSDVEDESLWKTGTDGEVGKFVPFPYATESTTGKMISDRFTGDTGGDWVRAGFRLISVPDPVHGFTVEFKINALVGKGGVAYRNLRLTLVEDYFRDGFEAPEGQSAATSLNDDPLKAGTWLRAKNTAKGYAPWSRVAYNNQNRYTGERSLQIEPKGFNVRLETEEFFELNSNRSYVFRGALNTRRMEGMKAWFEILLYDENRQPVTIDGLETVHGQNVFRSPKRGDISSQLLWESLNTPEGWYYEEIVLDDLRPIDTAASSELKQIDRRKRKSPRYARIAIVVAGNEPSYSAQVLVDEIELRENPRVQVNLFQQEKVAPSSLPGGMGTPEEGEYQYIGVNFATPRPLASGRPYRLLIGLEVTGLVPNRLGYHYTLDLYDYLGRRVNAADTIGSDALDKVVVSSSDGTIGTDEFGYIDLDSLDVTNRFGYFSAHFRLSYKDEKKPVIERRFKIGFMPESIQKKGTPSDLGVVLDLNSTKQRWLNEALEHLNVGRIAMPLTRQDMAPNGSDYRNTEFLEDFTYLMRLMPNVRRTAMVGPLPDGFSDLHASGNADGVFSDTTRQEWRDLVRKIHGHWQDRFDDYIMGDVADSSFNDFASHASQAYDNLESEFAANRLSWAARILPLTLKSGAEQQKSLEAFTKSFERRWTDALAAQSAENKTAISNAMTPDDERKVGASFPSKIWLKEGERFSFYVPAELSAAEMENSAQSYLSRIAKFEDVLGVAEADAVANAQSLSTGNAIDFNALLDDRANADLHTVVIDIKRVPQERFSEQLADLIEKVARARAIGFKRIFVSRLRNTGSDDAPDGLMTRSNLAQPAFYAYRTLNAVLSGRQAEDIALNMKNGSDYLFFRDPDTDALTFMLFPGEEDVIEDLPFGNDAELIDIMGNTSALSSLPAADGTPSGMVRLRVAAKGLPLIITGIDNTLLDVVQSLTLDNTTIEASQRDQQRTLSLTNSFDSRVTVNLSIPLTPGSAKDRNISWDSRIKTMRGIESGGSAKAFNFDSTDLATGETGTFPFILKPRGTMGTGERYLPVRVVVKGKKVYEFTQRIKVDVQSQLSVVETTALDLGNRGLDVIFKIQSSQAQAQGFSATFTLPDHSAVRARNRSFTVQPNGSTDVSVSFPMIPKSKQEGLRIALNIQQRGGTDFYNESYRLTADEESGGLKLVPDKDYVAP